MPEQRLQFRPAPGWLPRGKRVYAIGDIHGCDEHLAALHALIAEDLAARPTEAPLLLHIGDYVDRGPDSAGVVARLAAGPPVPGLRVVNLMGNHERTMLDALNGERSARTDWLFTGGRPALASWGADPEAPAETWRRTIPVEHQDFLHRLALHHREGGYLFVHAGIRPGLPMEEQESDDFLRIRHVFLNSEADHGVVVVHGHTPTKDGPTVRRNRIGIDTGAVFGRELTCLVLEGEQLAFLQVS